MSLNTRNTVSNTGLNRYNFTVRVRTRGNEQTVKVWVVARNRDTAALYVPEEICNELGYTVPSYDMLIIEG